MTKTVSLAKTIFSVAVFVAVASSVAIVFALGPSGKHIILIGVIAFLFAIGAIVTITWSFLRSVLSIVAVIKESDLDDIMTAAISHFESLAYKHDQPGHIWISDNVMLAVTLSLNPDGIVAKPQYFYAANTRYCMYIDSALFHSIARLYKINTYKYLVGIEMTIKRAFSIGMWDYFSEKPLGSHMRSSKENMEIYYLYDVEFEGTSNKIIEVSNSYSSCVISCDKNGDNVRKVQSITEKYKEAMSIFRLV